MPQFIDLQTALSTLDASLNETELLTVDAYQWSLAPPSSGYKPFSTQHKELITETAFLRAFLSWEQFLEETFILYLLGMVPPRGSSPQRYASPLTLEIAQNLVVPEDRSYVKWTTVSNITKRAQRFFKDGKPFAPALTGLSNAFTEMQIIRNAIAHQSTSAQDRFKRLARDKSSTGTISANLTVGRFLSSRIPGSSPPETFFGDYLNRIRFAADKIVPT